MKAGQSSAAIPLQQGWTVARLLELSIPEDPQARAKAEADAPAGKRRQAVRLYSTDRRKRLA